MSHQSHQNIAAYIHLKNEFNFWNDSMNIPKIEFITYIYILL